MVKKICRVESWNILLSYRQAELSWVFKSFLKIYQNRPNLSNKRARDSSAEVLSQLISQEAQMTFYELWREYQNYEWNETNERRGDKISQTRNWVKNSKKALKQGGNKWLKFVQLQPILGRENQIARWCCLLGRSTLMNKKQASKSN